MGIQARTYGSPIPQSGGNRKAENLDFIPSIHIYSIYFLFCLVLFTFKMEPTEVNVGRTSKVKNVSSGVVVQAVKLSTWEVEEESQGDWSHPQLYSKLQVRQGYMRTKPKPTTTKNDPMDECL